MTEPKILKIEKLSSITKDGEFQAWVVFYEEDGEADYVYVFANEEITALTQAQQAIQQNKEIRAIQKLVDRGNYDRETN